METTNQGIGAEHSATCNNPTRPPTHPAMQSNQEPINSQLSPANRAMHFHQATDSTNEAAYTNTSTFSPTPPGMHMTHPYDTTPSTLAAPFSYNFTPRNLPPPSSYTNLDAYSSYEATYHSQARPPPTYPYSKFETSPVDFSTPYYSELMNSRYEPMPRYFPSHHGHLTNPGTHSKFERPPMDLVSHTNPVLDEKCEKTPMDFSISHTSPMLDSKYEMTPMDFSNPNTSHVMNSKYETTHVDFGTLNVNQETTSSYEHMPMGRETHTTKQGMRHSFELESDKTSSEEVVDTIQDTHQSTSTSRVTPTNESIPCNYGSHANISNQLKPTKTALPTHPAILNPVSPTSPVTSKDMKISNDKATPHAPESASKHDVYSTPAPAMQLPFYDRMERSLVDQVIHGKPELNPSDFVTRFAKPTMSPAIEEPYTVLKNTSPTHNVEPLEPQEMYSEKITHAFNQQITPAKQVIHYVNTETPFTNQATHSVTEDKLHTDQIVYCVKDEPGSVNQVPQSENQQIPAIKKETPLTDQVRDSVMPEEITPFAHEEPVYTNPVTQSAQHITTHGKEVTHYVEPTADKQPTHSAIQELPSKNPVKQSIMRKRIPSFMKVRQTANMVKQNSEPAEVNMPSVKQEPLSKKELTQSVKNKTPAANEDTYFVKEKTSSVRKNKHSAKRKRSPVNQLSPTNLATPSATDQLMSTNNTVTQAVDQDTSLPLIKQEPDFPDPDLLSASKATPVVKSSPTKKIKRAKKHKDTICSSTPVVKLTTANELEYTPTDELPTISQDTLNNPVLIKKALTHKESIVELAFAQLAQLSTRTKKPKNNYQCQYCLEGFERKKHLNMHLPIHTVGLGTNEETDPAELETSPSTLVTPSAKNKATQSVKRKLKPAKDKTQYAKRKTMPTCEVSDSDQLETSPTNPASATNRTTPSPTDQSSHPNKTNQLTKSLDPDTILIKQEPDSDQTFLPTGQSEHTDEFMSSFQSTTSNEYASANESMLTDEDEFTPDDEFNPISQLTPATQNLIDEALNNKASIAELALAQLDHLSKRTKKNKVPFQCEYCFKTFERKNHHTMHLRIHTGEKPFSCELCGKSFANRHHLTPHMRIHTGEKPHQCPVCEMSFSQRGNLQRHSMLHTGEKPHTCETCNKSFAEKSSLRRHYAVHTGEKKYGCEICNKHFADKGNLARHIRGHTMFAKKDDDTNEMQIDFGERLHTCDICGMAFTEKSNLNKHVQLHTGERPHTCELCDRSFTEKSSLQRHMSVHTGDTGDRHTCNVCGESFLYKTNLDIHVQIHTVESPSE